MPPRSAKLRQYAMSAKRYVASEPALLRLMAAHLSNRTPEEHFSDLSVNPRVTREKHMKQTLSGVVSEIESNKLTCGLRPDTVMLILSMLSPLIPPNSSESSPEHEDTQSSPEVEHPPPRTETVQNNDRELPALTVSTLEPYVPPTTNAAFDKVAPVAKTFSPVKPDKKRAPSRGPSRASVPKKRPPVVPEMAIRSASPTIGLVPVVKSSSITISDLKRDSGFVEDFGLPGDELSGSDVDKRMTYWQLHGHTCMVCSWIARFFLTDLTPLSRVPADDRKNMIVFHVFGKLDAQLDYSDVKEGMNSEVFVEDKINLLALSEYLRRNS